MLIVRAVFSMQLLPCTIDSVVCNNATIMNYNSYILIEDLLTAFPNSFY